MPLMYDSRTSYIVYVTCKSPRHLLMQYLESIPNAVCPLCLCPNPNPMQSPSPIHAANFCVHFSVISLRPPLSGLCSSASAFSAFLFKKLKYVCHPIAITPAKIDLYCASMNVKLIAVTAGQSFRLLIIEVGTVCFILVKICSMVSPERKDCMLKK